jgi:hypothetical protein
MEPLDLALLLLGTLLGYAAFTYAFLQDNYFFATAENVFIGAGSVLALNVMFSTLASNLTQIASGRFLLIIPVIAGAMAFTRLTRYRWAARYPTAILGGVGVGVIFGLNIRSQIIAMITSSIKDLTTATLGIGPKWPTTPDYVSVALMIVTSGCVVLTFIYSAYFSRFTHEKGSLLYYATRFGRIMFMFSVGYMSRSTFFANSLNALLTFLSSTIIPIKEVLLGLA